MTTRVTLVGQYVDAWRPRTGWAEHYVRPAYLHCIDQIIAPDSIPWWTRLAIMLGDSHATPLCLVVALHARSLLPEIVEDRSVDAHVDICLWQLGLAAAKEEHVPLKAFGEPATLRRDADRLAEWLERELAPFEGDLARAAKCCLRLAACRTGVVAGAEDVTIETLLDDGAWRIVEPQTEGATGG